jgi:hypothetical protein
VRVFGHQAGHSREVYHTKRMQRVFCVKFSGDAGYVLSGSDDMNVRIWKAHAAEQLGTMLPREKRKHAYKRALVDRYVRAETQSRLSKGHCTPALPRPPQIALERHPTHCTTAGCTLAYSPETSAWCWRTVFTWLTYPRAGVDRYRHVPEIKRIERHRHVPKVIHKAGKMRRTVADAAAVKQARRVAHAKEGSMKTAPARKRKVVNQEE